VQVKASDSILLAVSGDGQRMLTVSKPDNQESDLMLWETGTGILIASINLTDREPISCAALDADGDQLAVASRDPFGKPVLRFLKVAAGGGSFEKISEVQDKFTPATDIVSASFDRDGTRLGVVLHKAGENESHVAICDVATEAVRVLAGQESSLVGRVQLSPSGKYLLEFFSRPGEPEGRARLWRLDDKSAAPSELHHTSAITTAAFSPDERLLLTGGRDDDARLWPIANGRVASSQVLREEGSEHTHTADLTLVLLSPDGRRALTASKDQTALLWDLASVKRIAILRHSAYVSDATFSRRGELILTSSGEPKLRVWSAITGELLALFTPSGDVLQASFTPNGDSLVAIEQNSAKRSVQADSVAGGQPATRAPLRELRSVIWSFVPLQDDLADAGQRGALLAARQIEDKLLKKTATEDLPKMWGSESLAYLALFGREPDPTQYHLDAAQECEATKQWFAAAWHLTKLLELSHDNASRAKFLLRRAEAYAAADNWADSLPRCISDRKAAIELGLNLAQDYRALAKAYIDYGNASGKGEQWNLAIEALREGARLNPGDTLTFIRLGEAFAGKRDFAQAETEFERAQALGSTAAPARLGLMGWLQGDEEGKKRYRDMCLALGNPSIAGWEAFSLLWPSVLTNAFEKDDQYKAFREEVVRRAQESSNEAPSDIYRRNTLGAALYRAGRYEEAIKELEAARAGYLAERANTLSQHYDRLIRIPISRTPEGRSQDWAFLAMANARLNRRSEAWNWIRKLRESPELVRAAQPDKRDYPVSYETLAVELLYDEAFKLVRELSRQPGLELGPRQ